MLFSGAVREKRATSLCFGVSSSSRQGRPQTQRGGRRKNRTRPSHPFLLSSSSSASATSNNNISQREAGPAGVCSALQEPPGMHSSEEDTFFTEVEQERSSKIPVIYTGSVLLPTDRNQFLIHEPYYLEMFRSIGVGGVFGHCLHSNAAPESMKEGSISIGDMDVGLKGPGIEVGCLAIVRDIQEVAGNAKELIVKYECTRRFFVTEYDKTALFSSTQVEWSDDNDIDEAAVTGDVEYLKYIDAAERTLWDYLLEIAKLEKALGHSKNSLPEAVMEFAPPEIEKRQYSRASIDEGIWKGTAKPKKPPTLNSSRLSKAFSNRDISPYLVIGENTDSCRSKRQELFAFAAASLVAETSQEQLALLTSRSTRAKLEWVIAAAKPYLEMLRAENQLYKSI